MRREPEYFGEAELDLLYMAKRLREALRLEEVLTNAGIDYLVETGSYIGGLLFRRELTGAFFYVTSSALASAREILIRNRFKPYDPD